MSEYVLGLASSFPKKVWIRFIKSRRYQGRFSVFLVFPFNMRLMVWALGRIKICLWAMFVGDVGAGKFGRRAFAVCYISIAALVLGVLALMV